MEKRAGHSREAGMGVKDLVKVTHYLVHEKDIEDYVAVRALPRRRASSLDAPSRARAGQAGNPGRDRSVRGENLKVGKRGKGKG